jgi:hypothetical protein
LSLRSESTFTVWAIVIVETVVVATQIFLSETPRSRRVNPGNLANLISWQSKVNDRILEHNVSSAAQMCFHVDQNPLRLRMEQTATLQSGDSFTGNAKKSTDDPRRPDLRFQRRDNPSQVLRQNVLGTAPKPRFDGFGKSHAVKLGFHKLELVHGNLGGKGYLVLEQFRVVVTICILNGYLDRTIRHTLSKSCEDRHVRSWARRQISDAKIKLLSVPLRGVVWADDLKGTTQLLCKLHLDRTTRRADERAFEFTSGHGHGLVEHRAQDWGERVRVAIQHTAVAHLGQRPKQLRVLLWSTADKNKVGTWVRAFCPAEQILRSARQLLKAERASSHVALVQRSELA